MKTQIMSDAVETTHQACVSELVEVLRDELSAHHHLLQLELTKREAIIARNGEVLKESATEQARELHRIDLLESRRDRLAQKLIPGKSEIRLAEIIESENISAPEKKELSRYQVALQAALQELKKISELNAKMLIDSRDLFKAMLSSLAGTGHGHERRTARPVLVDANC